MAAPVDDFYQAASGSIIQAGIAVPPPAWLDGVAVGEWVSISDTILAGTAADPESVAVKTVGAYNGMAFRDDTSEIFLLANGGHNDSSFNGVASIDLREDAPAWQLRCAATAGGSRTSGSAYNADGKPNSRHTYSSSQWVPERNRLMNFGARFLWANAASYAAVDGFDPDSNTWDAAGTWADAAGWAAGTCRAPDTGNVYTCGNYFYFYKWTQATNTWSTSAAGLQVYGPLVFDPVRQHVFSLSKGDNVGSATTPALNAVKCNADLSGKTAISFNASAAYSEYSGAASFYTPALVYDPINDRYLLYRGYAGDTQRVYTITPNSGTTWDMGYLTTTGATPPASDGTSGSAGCNNKFAYAPELGGCVLLARGDSNIYFLRTA